MNGDTSIAKSADRLVDDLRRHDWPTNLKTADALARAGASALPALLRALQDEDGYVRNGAAIALGKIGNADAAEPLIAALRWRDDRVYADDEDREARISAATALGKLRVAAASLPLMTELDAVLKTDLTLASYIVEALGEIGNDQAISTLASLVDHPDFDIQKAASYALAQMGTEGTDILLRIASDCARKGRVSAVKALGMKKVEAASPVLERILTDENDDKLVRGQAAQALGRIGSAPTVLPLLLSTLQGRERELRSSALLGLAFLHDAAAFESIVAQLGSPDLRYIAVVALGELGDMRACERLILMLASEDEALAFHAATALGRIGCPNAVPALIKLCDRIAPSPVSAAIKTAVRAAIDKLEAADQAC